ncbi:MAG: threonine/serine dehydratase [Eubacteriales bacterium]|nr:threonine/serine dehydratase [Eubacteriales bacterium]
MALTLNDIEKARDRISSYVIKTPLIRLQNLDSYLGCEVYIKAECMQTTGAFKLRGAMNKVLSLTEEELRHGIVAASSGNHGKALAYAAKMLGVKAAIVLPYTAAKVKVDTIRAWGAEIVQCDVSERFEVAERLCRERGAVLVPPYNDEEIMAGQGTAGLEIMEQCPGLDTVVVPVSGGGLIGGVSTAVKAVSPQTRVYGAEPAVLPRYTASLKAGRPVRVEPSGTVADALVSQIPGEICFPCVAANTDAIADVGEEYILKGMKLLLLEGKILCEPSSAIGIGAVLQGLLPIRSTDRVCFLISGGSVSLEQIARLERISI